MARVVARALWVVPVALLLLSAQQAKVAYDLRSTWKKGAPATAEVIEWESSNRADVTYGYVSLTVPLADGTALTKHKMSLPHSLLPRLKGKNRLAVHVRKGAPQEVVINRIMPAHWLIAASQVGISFAGAVMFFAGVCWWSVYLRRPPGATPR